MSSFIESAPPPMRQGSPLLYFLVFVSAIFIGILIFAYVVTNRTNPVYLDQNGRPVNSAPAHTHAQGR
jgi:hypothetical protein